MTNRLRKYLKFMVAITAISVIAGCATFEGQIDLENLPKDVTWISPINQDGLNDELKVEFSLPSYKDLVISEYRIIIEDQTGKTVYKQGEVSARKKKPGVKIPESISWAGVDQNGKYLPDGDYFYHIDIFYGNEQSYKSLSFMVIIDNTAPSVEISAAYPLFSPDGDGRLDTVRIFQRFSSIEAKWEGKIINSAGTSVKTFVWKGIATDFVWNGKDTSEKYVPDGEYSYIISSTDEASNKSVFSLDGITVNTERSPVSISRNLESFSPNNDGKKDTLLLTTDAVSTTDLTLWTVSIHNSKGETVRSYSGEKSLPASVLFDGKDNSGRILPDGFYKGHISLTFKNGSMPENVSQLFEIDNAPPLVYLSAAYLLFSPDGDGRRDTLKINQSTSQEDLWSASILNNSGNEIRKQTWTGRASQFEWNALDSNGIKVPDGTYSYRIECTDKADNQTVKELKSIRIDTRIPVVRISSNNKGASPDGDGMNDFISFDLTTNIPEEIGTWGLEIVNHNGDLTKSFGSNEITSALPSRIDWDGVDEKGIIREDEYTARLSVEYLKGNYVTSITEKTFRVDINGPEAEVSVSPAIFSPDQDGVDDILNIKATAKDVSGIDFWKIRIIDPAGNNFRTFAGTGESRDVIKWKGLSDKNELVQSASDYSIQYTVTDKMGNSTVAETTVPIDILVMKDGENLKIIISSIYFVPNKADYLNVNPEEKMKNLATLDRLAEILKKYSQYRIRLEGHTARVYWDNPARLQTEQDEVLLPLSVERAEVIKEALIARGINATRLTTMGYGGNRPVVPHSDITNRWKNRRVEFILIKK